MTVVANNTSMYILTTLAVVTGIVIETLLENDFFLGAKPNRCIVLGHFRHIYVTMSIFQFLLLTYN